jgi:hypothetical protein
VLRYQPKDFRVQRYEDGEWLWGRGKAPYRLYRLLRVTEAVQAGERVWLVEGEKDADAMTEQAGVAATTTPGGAGKTWRPEYIEALRGAYVTIVADRDEAGRAHARRAAAALAEAAAEVVLVEPNVNRPHADAADHLAAGFGLDDFTPLDTGNEFPCLLPENPLPPCHRYLPTRRRSRLTSRSSASLRWQWATSGWLAREPPLPLPTSS